MKKLYYLTSISILLAAISIWAIIANPFQIVPSTQPAPDWKPPFQNYIAGEGFITPSPDLIPLRPAESGQVSKTFVKVGDNVTKGQALLELNTQDLLAEKLRLMASLQTALAQESSAQSDFDYYRKMYHKDNGKFISKQDYTHAQNLLNIAQKKVLEKKAALQSVKIETENRTLKASYNGKLVHFSAYPGMWLRADESPADEILLQPDNPLQLRVELNQFDIIHFSPDAKAIAWLPNRPKQKILLHFDHIEPLVHAKTLVSGRSTELTDTRVITLVYDILPTKLPLFSGEQFDVFIAAKP